jgi:hypothetical protein
MLCAIAVAMATFHVCDVTAVRSVDLVIASATADDAGRGRGGDIIAVEKCHTCAVVPLPALTASVTVESPIYIIPRGTVLNLTSFIEPTVGPPPRA